MDLAAVQGNLGMLDLLLDQGFKIGSMALAYSTSKGRVDVMKVGGRPTLLCIGLAAPCMAEVMKVTDCLKGRVHVVLMARTARCVQTAPV